MAMDRSARFVVDVVRWKRWKSGKERKRDTHKEARLLLSRYSSGIEQSRLGKLEQQKLKLEGPRDAFRLSEETARGWWTNRRSLLLLAGLDLGLGGTLDSLSLALELLCELPALLLDLLNDVVLIK